MAKQTIQIADKPTLDGVATDIETLKTEIASLETTLESLQSTVESSVGGEYTLYKNCTSSTMASSISLKGEGEMLVNVGVSPGSISLVIDGTVIPADVFIVDYYSGSYYFRIPFKKSISISINTTTNAVNRYFVAYYKKG